MAKMQSSYKTVPKSNRYENSDDMLLSSASLKSESLSSGGEKDMEFSKS